MWAIGDPIGGMVLYIENDQVHFHYNGFGDTVSVPPFPLNADSQSHSYSVTLDYEAQENRAGRGRLLQGKEEKVPWTNLSPTMTFGVFEGLDIGLDRRGPVLWDLYERHGAFAYSGTVHDVRVVPL